MDDPATVILIVLFGILGIFILVRIVKYASRTVDEEQKGKQPLSGAPATDTREDRVFHFRSSTADTPPQVAPLPEIPPAKPTEIRLGMTPPEVEAALGVPETKADLGEKLLYKYKNMTVEFKTGKVIDVR